MKAEQKWEEVQKIMKQEGDTIEVGPYYGHAICWDIKHLGFTLSRYKFVSKLFAYKDNISVCELGCQEAWGGIMFEQNNNLSRYVGIDLDSNAIAWNNNNLCSKKMSFLEGNFFDVKPDGHFDVVLSLDVIEHIERDLEDQYVKVAMDLLEEDGVFVVGTPNEKMNPYASEASKVAHINLYDQKRLYSLMSRFFKNVFIFNMNDEVVNTGFAPMSCYIIAVCSGKK